VKSVKNLFKRPKNALWFHECNIPYVLTNGGSYTMKLHS